MSSEREVVETVWLDASLLMVGNLHQPAGILRTSAHLFRAWWGSGFSNFRLCRIDVARGGYSLVEPEELMRRFEPPPPPPAPRPRGRLAARAARRLARALPAPARSCLRALLQPRPARPAPPPLLDFGPGDLLLHLGGSWVVPGSSALTEQIHRRRGLRVCHLIYDLIPVLLPQFFPQGMIDAFRDYLVPAIRQSGLLLAISEHTRRDLELFARQEGLALPPVEVVRLGDDLPPAGARCAPPPGLAAGHPFVLSVGTLEVRKNHHLLYHLWRRLAQRHGDRLPRLVLAGAPGWMADDLLHQLRTDPLTRDSVVHLPGCRDWELGWLYRHCLFTLYPSHYEGWGLPVAEALAYGKPVVCSDAASLPEVGPGMCVLLDPCDLPAWLAAVERLLFDPAALRELQELARGFRGTSWQGTAARCVAHLERHFGPAFRLPASGLARPA